MACRGCSEIIVYDSAYPYPKALGIAVASQNAYEAMDAFNVNRNGVGGDYDNDGVGEFHAIALKFQARGGELAYSYIIAPLSHGWTLRLPQVEHYKLATVLTPTLHDILYKTGFNEALSSLQPHPITETVTITETTTTTETKTITEIRTLTSTYWKTETTTTTKTMKSVYTVREAKTLTETITLTSEDEPAQASTLIAIAIMILSLAIATLTLARKR